MKSVLVVDDSSFMRAFITQALTSAGFTVTQATNGRDALNKCGSNKYACVVTDLLMPEMDGIGLLQGLRAQNLQVPVVVMTADIQHTTRTQCEQLGAYRVLNKPPKVELLCEAVQSAVAPSIA